ncbi:MAG: AAA domain-containing protein [Spirochaetes bacterium]|jgi:hypothetical protein|nr:AAA domain-containing protein [Spirochaetota bacterium]
MYYLSPSRIARYFYHECDRYLRYHSTPKESREAEGVPGIDFDASPVTAAMLKAGYRWEEDVIQNLLRGRVRIAESRGSGSLSERSHTFEETLVLLDRLKPGEAIYQATLKVPDAFYQKYNIDPDLCNFPQCRPDLILMENVNDSPRIRVIDIKASKALKVSHRIQATLYSIMIDEILNKHGISAQLDTDTAGIWLYGAKDPEWFEQRISTGIITQFLNNKLKEILTLPIDDVQWHLFFRCEWCEFYEKCRQDAEKSKSISLIPYLSVGGHKFLREHVDDPVKSMEELISFLDRDDAESRLGCCGSLRGKHERLENSAMSLKNGNVIPHGGSSLAFPRWEDINITITLQSDPVSGLIYTAGFRRLKGKDVYGSGSNNVIFIAKNPEDCGRVKYEFIKALHAELSILDMYNRDRDWQEQKSVQAYVYDGYELSLFNDMLIQAVRDPDLAELALKLLFHFQDTVLSESDEHPTDTVPFPIIIIVNVIRDLLALPIPISFRLPDVFNILKPKEMTYTFKPRDLFWFNLSNTLKSDSIFFVWHKERDDALEWIESEIKLRLAAAQTVIEGIRNQVGGRLFAYPHKFQFPRSFAFRNPELSRLAFIVHYESFMSALEVRAGRTRPAVERIAEGICVPLKLVGTEPEKWEVLSPLDRYDLEGNDFFNFILVPSGDEGERAQMAYDDYANRERLWVSSKSPVRLAMVTDYSADKKTGQVEYIDFEFKSSSGAVPIHIGDTAFLYPRFTDYNSKRIINRLRELDEDEKNDFLSLIRDPCGFAVSIADSKKIETCNSIADKYAHFTPSQNNAYEHAITSRLTLVWGPPGTGKTSFLAGYVLCLVRAAMEDDHPLHIAITAFTHAAIENLLEDIRSNLSNFGLSQEFPIHKLKYLSTQRGAKLSELREEDLSTLLMDNILITGGTVYSYFKSKVKKHFPILIVDEASQMKFGELAMAMSILEPGGRLILAGDDLQLPPIINALYPDPEDGLPGLHESIFSYLRARDDENSPFTCQLFENWRMNQTLCDFAAETLYGEKYQPANEIIKNRKINLGPSNGNDDAGSFCDWLADPERPLVVAILEDVQATVENEVEAQLTALMAEYFRDNLLQSNGELYPDTSEGDDGFWRNGLFIVSPHHAQIAVIRRNLAQMRDWHAPVFVDTVDKMQGQQCRAVIVSYGVSDNETALAEAHFIYSLNRLNVSVTRAESKSIVFLPRPLLNASFAVLENHGAAEGLNHMLALVDYCRRKGDEKTFNLEFIGSGGRITVMRAG